MNVLTAITVYQTRGGYIARPTYGRWIRPAGDLDLFDIIAEDWIWSSDGAAEPA